MSRTVSDGEPEHTMNNHEKTLPAGVTVRVILVRHGEPEASARGRCYGKLDVGLSAHGRYQAALAAEALQGVALAAVYASPRRRARESAEVIAAAHNRNVNVEDDLAEIDFGDFENLTYDEVARRYPQEYRLWMERPTEIEFPNGESFALMQSRVTQTAKRLRAAHAGSAHQTSTAHRTTTAQAFAVVSHGGVNRILLAEALNMNARDIFRLDQTYGAISVIDYYDEETPVVRSMNAVHQPSLIQNKSPR